MEYISFVDKNSSRTGSILEDLIQGETNIVRWKPTVCSSGLCYLSHDFFKLIHRSNKKSSNDCHGKGRWTSASAGHNMDGSNMLLFVKVSQLGCRLSMCPWIEDTDTPGSIDSEVSSLYARFLPIFWVCWIRGFADLFFSSHNFFKPSLCIARITIKVRQFVWANDVDPFPQAKASLSKPSWPAWRDTI